MFHLLRITEYLVSRTHTIFLMALIVSILRSTSTENNLFLAVVTLFTWSFLPGDMAGGIADKEFTERVWQRIFNQPHPPFMGERNITLFCLHGSNRIQFVYSIFPQLTRPLLKLVSRMTITIDEVKRG
jgi:hypothetical protein